VADAVAALLANPDRALIALDFDGTLAPIVERPEDSRLAAGALDVLRLLAAGVGQLAVVSGRAADQVVRLGGLDTLPGLRVMGHYGLQSWHAGELSSPPPVDGVALARQRLPEVLRDAAEGVYVEDKRHSVAVHTRPAAAPQEALDDLTPALWALASETGLEAVPGKFVMELRPPGVDKGSALRALVADVAATTVIYVGDDVGDLPAFRAVAELRAAGTVEGLAVAVISYGADDAPSELREQADLVLPGPDAVVAWLAGIAALLAQTPRLDGDTP
jgi:trehalose 6-phosphate phosphatase